MHTNLAALHSWLCTATGMLDRIHRLRSVRSMWGPAKMQRATFARLEGASMRRTHHECSHASVLRLLMGQNGGTRSAVDTVRSYQDVACLARSILHARQEPSKTQQRCRLAMPCHAAAAWGFEVVLRA